ncbi:MAG: hypothetical protein J6K03_03995 [Oscillospiraceae bacterium]|nr:hypothetical protein [Oscillospiraceae bacterium]
MQRITLDISVKEELPFLRAKQGDVGRKFQVVVTDNGAQYLIPTDAVVSVWYSGTSGEGNYTDIAEHSAVSVEGNTVTVELITQMLKNKGGGMLCLIIHSSDGAQIGMWNIPYICEPVPGFESAAAELHFTALSKLVGDIKKTAETFETDTSFSISGAAADAKATGEALAKKAPAEFIYESINGGDANNCIGDYHKFCINFKNMPGTHGFLDVSYANAMGFLVNGEKPIILQELTTWNGSGKHRRYSTDNGDSWSEWEGLGLMAYPIGAVYLSFAETSPASLFGGRWEQLKDIFLAGAGDVFAAGSAGTVQTTNETEGTTNDYIPYIAIYMWKRIA